MAKGDTYRPCPRKCGGKILTGEAKRLNVVSKKDGKQVCTSCGVRENMEVAYASIQKT